MMESVEACICSEQTQLTMHLSVDQSSAFSIAGAKDVYNEELKSFIVTMTSVVSV